MPTPHRVEVLILQHPMEVAHAKGTARLLHLSLPHSTLLVGEQFAQDELRTRLHTSDGKQSILLYPSTPQDPAMGLSTPPPLEPATLQNPALLRLVVLDATWRKSRKMLYLNPALQQLPRLALRDPSPSGYLIRKAHLPHQLSTLEATCTALMQLEGNAIALQPLLAAFSGFVAQQLRHAAGP